MSTTLVMSRHEQLRERISKIDQRLQSLRARHDGVRSNLQKVEYREDRAVRLLAEADKEEKREIDRQLAGLIESKASLEREAKSLAITIAELDAERGQLFPEFERYELDKMAAEHRRKKADLAQEHTRLLEQRAAWLREGEKIDGELLRVANAISFLREQEFTEERLKAEHACKLEAQRRSPFYKGGVQ